MPTLELLEQQSLREKYGKRRAEDVYESLPEIEAGVDIERVSVVRLSDGRDARLHLSASERLKREGWNPKVLDGVRRKSLVIHNTGEVFEVVEVNKSRLAIKNPTTGMEGEVVAEPISIKAHEYNYLLRNRSGLSKKVKVFDTVYKDNSLDTAEFFDELMQSIPAQCLDVFDEIEIHRETGGASGHFRAEPSLLSDRKVLALYVSSEGYPIRQAQETLYHELGHAIVKYLKGSVNPGARWKKVMRANGNTVSEYAEKTRYPKKKGEPEEDEGAIEDIADSFRLYFASDGAKSEKASALREFVRPRFEKLDEVMEDLSVLAKTGALRKKLFKPKNVLDK